MIVLSVAIRVNGAEMSFKSFANSEVTKGSRVAKLFYWISMVNSGICAMNKNHFILVYQYGFVWIFFFAYENKRLRKSSIRFILQFLPFSSTNFIYGIILLVSKYGHIQSCDIAEACSLSWKRIEAPLCRLLWLSLDCRLSTTVHIHFAKMTKCGCRQ